MNDPATDPDDLVQKKLDLNHITNMSKLAMIYSFIKTNFRLIISNDYE